MTKSKKKKRKDNRPRHNNQTPRLSQEEQLSNESQSDLNNIGDNFARDITSMPSQGINFDRFSFEYAEPISTSISVLIPLKIKKKIWKNKFVDLGRLLPKTGLQQKQHFSLELGINQDISFVPEKQTCKIYTTEL